MTPKVQDIANAWSELGSNYAVSTPHKFGPSLSKLLAVARPGKEDVCLDVGTGTGHTAAQLALNVKKSLWSLILPRACDEQQVRCMVIWRTSS